jgi:4-methylaminobutanoate oxidase (formaldehyde-forming)
MQQMTTPVADGTSTRLPDRARVVVVGGGIIGTSVAYHLALQGWDDVVVIERNRLTSGTTWHAAGLIVTFGSLSQTSTDMRMYTRDLYERLEAETGLATGFSPVGFVEIAAEPDRLEEYRRVAAFNRHCGVDVHEISAGEVGELFPLAHTDDILAGFYVPGDGRANPVDITMSLARGARMRGATIVEGVGVTGVLTRDDAVTGVSTTHGDIESEYVVNCTGMWARQLGELSGVNIPLQAAEHYYLITEQIPGISADWPVIEDPASHAYYREEVGGLMIGFFEPVAAPWGVDGIPDGFAFGEITPDLDRMAPYVDTAMRRVPISAEIGIRKFFCGPESFTPDMSPIIGEAPELRNYFVAAGLNSIGILTAGGVGRIVANWIIDGKPDVDVTGFNIDRLHTYQATPRYRRERTVEALGNVYRCHYPTRSMQTARNIVLSPLNDRLAARGAYFRDVSGWEGADWFAPPGIDATVERLSWGRENWFPYWQAEHEAARSGVVLMDMSFMSKFRVEGMGAGRLLDHLSANLVDGDHGTITYTQWLNDAGGIEADLTVTKLGEDRFWVVAGDTARRHVDTWMRRHRLRDSNVTIADVTTEYAQCNLHGPDSRRLLEQVTAADLTTDAFPFRTARHIDIGGIEVLCVRITYVGELGYELYVAADLAGRLFDILEDRGKPMGLKHAGLKALSSLRMEKGYRDYGHGRDALVAALAKRPAHRRLVQVLVDDPEPLMFHGEIVYRNGVDVADIRAASYGFTLGGAVGLAMIEAGEPITAGYIADADWGVDIAGTRWPARVSLRPLYDPTSARVRV